MTNAVKIALSVASALVAAGASADVLPDGKVKHLLTLGGIVGTFVLALVARMPSTLPPMVDLEKVGKP